MLQSGKKGVPLKMFLDNEERPRKRRPTRAEKQLRPPAAFAVLLRASLMLLCLILFLSITVDVEESPKALKTFVQSAEVFAGIKKSSALSNTGVLTLQNKPALPGCSTSSFRKKPTEEIAKEVRPSIVGIIQYRKGLLKEAGEGSGIIMDSRGDIITNNHVVEGASSLRVVTSSGQNLAASVVGRDSRTDIAVIRVNAAGLKSAAFGNSDQCLVGEPVVAIGNPSGLLLAGSVTAGIISAINRNIDTGNGPMNLIQTDAAINPGNSGGALVNMYGQVVAINSAKIAQQGFEGLGFSIPIKTAKPIIESLIQYGYVKGRVRLGFSCHVIDAETGRLNGLPAGIYIDYVDPQSCSAKAGLTAGDILTAAGGRAVTTFAALVSVRDAHKPGDSLSLTVYRDSLHKELTMTVKLEEDTKSAFSVSDGSDKAGW